MTVCASWTVTHGPRVDGQNARNSPILWNRVPDKGGPAAGLRGTSPSLVSLGCACPRAVRSGREACAE